MAEQGNTEQGTVEQPDWKLLRSHAEAAYYTLKLLDDKIGEISVDARAAIGNDVEMLEVKGLAAFTRARIVQLIRDLKPVIEQQEQASQKQAEPE